MAEAGKKAAKSGSPLWQKILAIQCGAGVVYKDTMAKFGGKDTPTASIEAVLDVFLPLCEKHGVTIVPTDEMEIISHEWIEYINRYGDKKKAISILAKLGYRVVDTDTGEFHPFKVLGHGLDDQDKATGKLHTYCLKYAYAQMFSARKSVDDPDVPHDARSRKDGDQSEQRQVHREEQREERQGNREDKPASGDESKSEKKAKIDLEYKLGVTALKNKWPLKEAAESGIVPDLAGEYKAFVSSEGKKIGYAEARKHFNDFSLYWWLALDASGNRDFVKASANFKKHKSKLTKENADFVASVLKRREELDR